MTKLRGVLLLSAFLVVPTLGRAVVTDNFNRADGDPGANWLCHTSGLAIYSNGIIGAASGHDELCNWSASAFARNQYAQLKMTALGSASHYLGPAVRTTFVGHNGYLAWVSSGSIKLYKTVNSSKTLLGSAAAPSVNDVVRIEVTGNAITVLVNGGIVIGPVTDTTFLSGAAGLTGYSNTGHEIIGDDFEAGDLAPADYPFTDGFEGATTVPPWDVNNVAGNPSINANLTYVHSGTQSLQGYYYVVGSDSNRYVARREYFGQGLDHFFIRGYFYQKTPEAGGSKDLQRKLFYLMSPVFAPDRPIYEYAALINTFTTAGTGHLMSLSMDHAERNTTPNVHFWPSPAVYLNFDQWYCLELEVKANTPGVEDGEERVWVDGIKVAELTNIMWRPAGFSKGIINFQVGDQTSQPTVTADEYRYWDDVVISATYIGVIPDLPPLPPGTPLALLGSAGEVFDARKVGTTSAARPVILQSAGSGALTITSIAVSGDFARTHDCPITPATLASGDFCTISVTFTPTLGGARTGTLTVVDDAADTPQAAPVSGTGTLEVIVKGGASFSGGVTIR